MHRKGEYMVCKKCGDEIPDYAVSPVMMKEQLCLSCLIKLYKGDAFEGD